MCVSLGWRRNIAVNWREVSCVRTNIWTDEPLALILNRGEEETRQKHAKTKNNMKQSRAHALFVSWIQCNRWAAPKPLLLDLLLSCRLLIPNILPDPEFHSSVQLKKRCLTSAILISLQYYYIVMLYYIILLYIFIIYSSNSNGACNINVIGSILRECMKQWNVYTNECNVNRFGSALC